MQIAKPTLAFIIIMTALIAGTAGYLAQTLNINQEKARLNQRINELESTVRDLKLQLEAARVESQAGEGQDNQAGS